MSVPNVTARYGAAAYPRAGRLASGPTLGGRGATHRTGTLTPAGESRMAVVVILTALALAGGTVAVYVQALDDEAWRTGP